ncbi:MULTISPECIES: nicotinamide riboside transporter PnuC [Actinomadura]|uniref:Nicotinamide riboside transporter PnuC n=1 Tax=Actinomadura litoris TaxID=2678616 RepID=A0A7K1LBU8_9ACTN|nr:MULTISPECIES: nicotinamide riboside transporter PnuC [Actinomadura]MBT2209749.1 nicotinamide riboside transporter PnuC [Actinomadura sp. NEAU-AAG7]MUN41793.1 nicotinamide riboside transporter PnuC [Actinomadura litoris]
MSWLNADFSLFGEHILWTDLIGNVLSLAVVWLAMRKTLWTWPVQLAGALLLLAASLHAHVPGNALKQLLFCVLAVFGWAMWTRGRRRERGLAVRRATPRERAVLLAALAVGTVVVAELFIHLDWLKVAWSPWANAYIFVGSAVATFAQSRALVDFWVIWVLVDLVGVPLALNSGLYVSGAVYGIFFVMVVAGFRNWLRESRDVRTPRNEAVTA